MYLILSNVFLFIPFLISNYWIIRLNSLIVTISSTLCHYQYYNRMTNKYIIYFDKTVVYLSCLNIFIQSSTFWNYFLSQIGIIMCYTGVLIFEECPYEDRFCPQVYMHICMHIFAMLGMLGV